MVRRELQRAWGYKIINLPLCVCYGLVTQLWYHCVPLAWCGVVDCLPDVLTNIMFLLGLDCVQLISFSSSVSKGASVCKETSTLASHFPEHMQDCADWSLLVPSASRAEAVIAPCGWIFNATGVLHVVISCFLLSSYQGDIEPPPFPPARAHWIRAISKVRLQLQQVGWSIALLLFRAAVAQGFISSSS